MGDRHGRCAAAGWSGRCQFIDFVKQRGPQLADAFRVFQLVPILIKYVEDVDNLIDAGCDASKVYREAMFVNGLSQCEQQSLRVHGEDVDDCVLL